jgi:uncharacterized protein YfaS (alpha-2-macroglobulin family)
MCQPASHRVIRLDPPQDPIPLTVTASASPATVAVGDQVSVTLIIAINTNPADVTYSITGTPSGTASASGNAVFTGSVAAGQTATVTQLVTVTGPGSLGFSFAGTTSAGSVDIGVAPITPLTDVVTVVRPCVYQAGASQLCCGG